MEKHFFIFGFGYTASYIAARLSQQGFKVIGTSREPHQFAHNINYQIIDFHQKDQVMPLLQKSTHVLMTAPPSQGNDPVIAQYAIELIKLRRQFEWIGYLSSTGVYGDHQGAWVDENATLQPLSSAAKARLDAEQSWKNFADNFPIHIFRLAGIYGPYRNTLSDIVNGKAASIYKEGHYFSRIHVTDIVNVIMASISKPNPNSFYNVADDLPAPAHEVDQFATQLLNRNPLPLVPFAAAVLSRRAQEFYSANRKVCNRKIKEEFNIKLDYSDYKKGLTSLFENKEY